MKNSTERFSDRVENYIRYRPSYPAKMIGTLESGCQLTNDSTIADIGSGTGILTKLLLDRGYRVIGVEPNKKMREAAETLLLNYTNFTSVDGTAEQTTLDQASIDLIVAGQAFHWFDPRKSRTEFRRILRESGWIALIWNQRMIDTSPFSRDYESLLQKYALDYAAVNHTNVGEDAIAEFFGSNSFESVRFPNAQTFDFDGLKGRCLSSSYTPNFGSPGHDALVSGLETLFRKHEADGRIQFEYETIVYYGRLTN